MSNATRWILLGIVALAVTFGAMRLGGNALALPLMVGLIAGAIAGRTARARA